MKTGLLLALGASALWAQDHAPKLEFQVASVRPSAPQQNGVNLGLHLDGAQARIAAFTFRDYVAMAYHMKAYQISGPDWTLTDRFDLTAKLPPGATSDQIPEMLQAFLADRFQLKIHRDKKELPVYALVLGKSPLKLKEAPAGADDDGPPATTVAASGSNAGVSVDLGHGTSYSFANNKLDAKKFGMDTFATTLERYLDRPIVNMTDLKGKYDLTLEITEEEYQTMLIRAALSAGMTLPPQVTQLLDSSSTASLMDAIQQLGLKLDSRKAPIDFLVIDQALKNPTDN